MYMLDARISLETKAIFTNCCHRSFLQVQPTVTSPHLYTKPSKKKKPARKPTTTTTDSPSVTDGDSGRETMSPDQQLTGDENSDLTPPLPPRNYVNVDVDTMPPSGSDEKIAGTSEQPQERKSSCVLLLEAQTGNMSVSCLLLARVQLPIGCLLLVSCCIILE